MLFDKHAAPPSVLDAKHQILTLLRSGPATTAQLSEIDERFGALIAELEAEGFEIEKRRGAKWFVFELIAEK